MPELHEQTSRLRPTVQTALWFILIFCLLVRFGSLTKPLVFAYLVYLPGGLFGILLVALLLAHLPLQRKATRIEATLAVISTVLAAVGLMGWRLSLIAPQAGVPEMRVVTMNIDGYHGEFDVAIEALGTQAPQVVCFQEIFLQEQLQALKEALPNHRFSTGGDEAFDPYLLQGVFLAYPESWQLLAEEHFHLGVALHLLSDWGPVWFVSLHGDKKLGLTPSYFSTTLTLQQRQLSELRATVPLKGASVVLGGDFNATSATPMMRSLKQDLQDSFEHAGRGFGYTFPSWLPIWRIDYLLSSPDWRPVSHKRFAVGSDHLALRVDYQRR